MDFLIEKDAADEDGSDTEDEDAFEVCNVLFFHKISIRVLLWMNKSKQIIHIAFDENVHGFWNFEKADSFLRLTLDTSER